MTERSVVPGDEGRGRERQEGGIKLKALSMCSLLHVIFIPQAILENTAKIK